MYILPGLQSDGSGIGSPQPATLAMPDDVVRQETTIAVHGGGFRPGEEVSLRLRVDKQQEPREFGRVRADGQGNLDQAQVALPEWVISGVHKVQGVGVDSGRRGESVLRVRAKGPWVSMNDHSAKQGSRFGLVAGGFEPREEVAVTLLPREGTNGAPAALGTLRADDVGNTPWTEFLLPVQHEQETLVHAAEGAGADEGAVAEKKPDDWWNQDLLLEGKQSGEKHRETITVVRLKPVVELSPWFGPPGIKVDINAQGFLPHEQVTVTLPTAGRAGPALVLAADEYGNLWGAGPLQVPYESPAGDLRIELAGEESRVPVETKFGVTEPKPWVELSSWSGYPGTGIIFTGGGWAAEEQVVAHLGSAAGPTVGIGKTDSQGWLTGIGPTTVPLVEPDPLADPDEARTVKYTLVGQRSGARASVDFALIVPYFDRPQAPAPAVPPAGPTPTPRR